MAISGSRLSTRATRCLWGGAARSSNSPCNRRAGSHCCGLENPRKFKPEAFDERRQPVEVVLVSLIERYMSRSWHPLLCFVGPALLVMAAAGGCSLAIRKQLPAQAHALERQHTQVLRARWMRGSPSTALHYRKKVSNPTCFEQA